MAKDKISDYSSTANSNTDIAGINIDEGCAPSGINDAIRTLMAQLKTWQSGGQDVYIHPAGSASAPSITANGDTNTGIFFPAADTVGISTGGTERARVDSSGNMGLGVTPSAWGRGKAIEVGSIGNGIWSDTGSNDINAFSTNAYLATTTVSTGWRFAYSGYALQYRQTSGQHQWYTSTASGTAGGTVTFTQAMTLDASGNLGVGTTSPSSYGQFAVVGNSTGNIYQATFANLNTGSNTTKQVSASWFLADTGGTAKRVASVLAYPDNANVLTGGMTFNVRKTDSDVSEVARIDSSGNLLVGTTSVGSFNGQIVSQVANTKYSYASNQTGSGTFYHSVFYAAGSQVGAITSSSTTTTYGTSSDYRLKTVIGPVNNAGQRIDALEPIEYEWKADGTRTRGFLAHKFQEVYAGSVNGSKDAVDGNGNPVYQSMQAGSSEVIADLVAEIQSLRQRLAAAGI